METARQQAEAHAQAIAELMRAADPETWERLEELRELAETPRYVAGWNMPGYLPDCEPAEFDSLGGACQYVAQEMGDHADRIEEAGSEPGISPSAWPDKLREDAQTLRIRPFEFSDILADVAYWVTEDGKVPLAADDAEELAELEALCADYESADDARDRIGEHPLSVEFRSAWVTDPREFEVDEFRIVLCCGGPHVELRGDVGPHGSANRVHFRYSWASDSGEYWGSDEESSAAREFAEYFLGAL